MANVLIGEEKEHPVPSLTQVYKVTHDGEGNRLPFMNRSFISFTYGGKHIEDFNLIATNSGDRMERDAYASFDDLTTTYDVIHGQFYWGTYFRSNTLTFNLTTDEMTQNELDDFKRWFRAGSIRELILAEHPNRGILARVSEPPQLSVLPFEKKVLVPFVLSGGQDEQGNPLPDIPGGTYTTSTTVYRGDITLTLVMDDPFWYSIYNVLPSYGQDGAEDWFRTLGIGADDNQEAAVNQTSFAWIQAEVLAQEERKHGYHCVITTAFASVGKRQGIQAFRLISEHNRLF